MVKLTEWYIPQEIVDSKKLTNNEKAILDLLYYTNTHNSKAMAEDKAAVSFAMMRRTVRQRGFKMRNGNEVDIIYKLCSYGFIREVSCPVADGKRLSWKYALDLDRIEDGTVEEVITKKDVLRAFREGNKHLWEAKKELKNGTLQVPDNQDGDYYINIMLYYIILFDISLFYTPLCVSSESSDESSELPKQLQSEKESISFTSIKQCTEGTRPSTFSSSLHSLEKEENNLSILSQFQERKEEKDSNTVEVGGDTVPSKEEIKEKRKRPSTLEEEDDITFGGIADSTEYSTEETRKLKQQLLEDSNTEIVEQRFLQPGSLLSKKTLEYKKRIEELQSLNVEGRRKYTDEVIMDYVTSKIREDTALKADEVLTLIDTLSRQLALHATTP